MIRHTALVLVTGASLVVGGCTASSSDKPPTVVATASATEVKTGATVQLDASRTTDPNKKALTFTWALKAPAGSKASIVKPHDAKTSFTADVQGVYAITLEVSNGKSNKVTKTLSVNAVAAPKPGTKSTPVIVNGADPSASETVSVPWAFVQANVSEDEVDVGRAITLGSTGLDDPENDAVIRTWTIVSKPEGSATVLSDREAARPTLTLDAVGRYELRLEVSDGVTTSTSTIEAEAVPAQH
jgi:hypothetical protein